MMERKDKVWSSWIVCQYDTDGSIEDITGEQLKFGTEDKIKGTVKPEEVRV